MRNSVPVPVVERCRKVVHAGYKSFRNSFHRRVASVTFSPYVILPFLAILVFFVLFSIITFIFVTFSPTQAHHYRPDDPQYHIFNEQIQFQSSSAVSNSISRIVNVKLDHQLNLHLDLLLNSSIHAHAYLITTTTNSFTSGPSSYMYSLRQLADVLQLSTHPSIIARAQLITLTLPVSSSLALSRHVTRAIYRSVGHPRPSAVQLVAYAGAHAHSLVQHGAHAQAAAYTWRLGDVSSEECESMEHRKRCEQVRDMLLVMYLGGCDGVRETDGLMVTESDNERGELKYAQPISCFAKRKGSNEIVKDVWKRYAIATCNKSVDNDKRYDEEQQQSVLNRLRGLAHSNEIDTSIRLRASSIVQWMEGEYGKHCS